jgi:hypothetical protein
MTKGKIHTAEEAKYKILFLNHAHSKSNMKDMAELFEMSFMGPLTETGLVDFEMLWVGPWMDTDQPLDWHLWQRCIEYKPDAVFVYGWWMHPDDKIKANYVSLFSLYLIRHIFNVRIFTLLFDLARDDFSTSDYLTRLCDRVFTHEHEDLFSEYSQFPEKHVVTTATFSPRLFHGDPDAPRDIELSFIGGISGYKDIRYRGVAALRERGIEVATPGGRGDGQKRLTNEEYAGFIRSSKIVINWSRHISGKWFQPKARIFETTLAGSLLLCEECDPVNMWLKPNHDYVPFSNTEELAERAQYYLQHEEERLQIARQGHQTAMATFSANILWKHMIDHMRGDSLYLKSEGEVSLKKNASANEVRVAHFLQRDLARYEHLDQELISEAVALVERAYRSPVRRLNWQCQRLVRLCKISRAYALYYSRRLLAIVVPQFIRRMLREKMLQK